MRVALAGVVQVVAPLSDHLLNAETPLQVRVQEGRHALAWAAVRFLTRIHFEVKY